MINSLANIVGNFEFEGIFLEAVPISSGHINDTYLANIARNSTINHMIVQRINHDVFGDPEGMMRNIQAVTEHLRQKIESAGGDPLRETLTLIPTNEGNYLYKSDQGDYWRAYIYINNARTYDVIEEPRHALYAGEAFGRFLHLLSDYPANKLVETIPNFHHTRKRFETFLAAVDKDEVNRASSSRDEINFVLERESTVSILLDEHSKGELPDRITHNDTKFNNVMIDNVTGRGVCVIDLDTVMPGLSLYDYGDAIRSITNTAPEDERDLSRVNFNGEIFEYYTQGYLKSAADILTSKEKEYLAFSAILMTLECGMRFLTDHLQGDTYFKIKRENQNLDRCRTQFKLVRDMEEQFDTMRKIVEKYC